MTGQSTLLSTGDLLRSASGRALAPVPRIDLSTNGRAVNTLARLAAWMIAEAWQEVGTCQHRLLMLAAMHPRRMSSSDWSSVNLLLFGEEWATEAHRMA